MKVLSASIRLVQKLNRPTKEGEFPIYITASFHGRVERATGISCTQKSWDEKREEIKKNCPNYLLLNKNLQDIKNKLIERRNIFEANGTSYNASMLFMDNYTTNVKKDDYRALYEAIVEERRLRSNTIVRYRYSYTKLTEFLGKDDIKVSSLNASVLRRFCEWMTDDGIQDGSIRTILSTIASVWNFGIKNKILDRDSYPFEDFEFKRKYKEKARDYYIEPVNMKKLKEYFLDMVVERNGSRWTYRDDAFERLHNRQSKEFALMWFLCCYKMNGSAPADVALLKKDNVSIIELDGEEYFRLQFNRIKTHTPVNCIIKRDMFTIIILEHFMGATNGKYVYPIVMDENADDRIIMNCIHRLSGRVRPRIREICKEVNQMTIESNVKNDLREPLINVDKVVLYTARHSRANEYLQQSNASVSGLATMLSRSPNTIATYIHQLQGNREIADINIDSVV